MSKLLLIVLMVGCLLTSCGFPERPIYIDRPTSGEKQVYGDVEFSWTLNGSSCDADPYVHSIHITIPGERLYNDGFYPCSQDGAQGIILERFAPGTYRYEIKALDIKQRPLYVASASFYINGDVYVEVNLLPLATRLSWDLQDSTAGFLTCDEADVSAVSVRIDGVMVGTFSCEEGQSPRSVIIPDLQPGTHTHTADIRAQTSDGSLFTYTGPFSKPTQGSPEVLLVLSR